MAEWIKPEEKMPEVNEPVMICRVYAPGELRIEESRFEGLCDWWKVYGTRIKTKNVKAWMPLPEPPEWAMEADHG